MPFFFVSGLNTVLPIRNPAPARPGTQSRRRRSRDSPWLPIGIAVLGANIAVPMLRAQQAPMDLARARQYFTEAKAASDTDHGALWGVELCGPLLFVDPDTRDGVANQADRETKLSSADGIFLGKVPPELGVANTAVEWAGVHWTMVMRPLPEFKRPRLRLILHECFHRIQERIGLPGADSTNPHLDSLDGRIWLQLEWRALERALWEHGEERRQDIGDAIYFRNFRRSLFPSAEQREDALEMNEGMAEYTGLKLSTRSAEELAVVTAASLRSAPRNATGFTRSFAYASGPAYGALLDAAAQRWRTGLTPATNLGQLLRRAYTLESPALSREEALRRIERYDGAEVVAIEKRREETHQAQVAEAKKLFLDGPVLVLPVAEEFAYTFDPNAVLGLDEGMTLYQGNIQLQDRWGVLHASEGALLVRENGKIVRVQVPAPTDAAKKPLAGPGWALDAKEGWKVVSGHRPGDFALQENKTSPEDKK